MNVKAIISDGRLMFSKGGGRYEEHVSEFVAQKVAEAERHAELNGWKQNSAGDGGMFGSAWGGAKRSARDVEFRCLAVRCFDDMAYYIITNGAMTGLFSYRFSDDYERRLFHKQDYHVCGFDFSPERQQFVISSSDEDGAYNLHLHNEFGRHEKTLTGGDSRDVLPRFHGDEVIYQSGGIGRSEDGYIMAHAPMEVMSLHLESGESKVLAGDESFDFLAPVKSTNGTLYFIRRPYQMYPEGVSLDRRILHVLLLPYYFIMSLYHLATMIANIKKPPTQEMATNVGKQSKNVDVMGTLVDCVKLKRDKGDQSYELVPNSWELVNENGEKLSTNVVAFETIGDQLYFTNGCKVFSLAGDEKSLLTRADIVTQLA